MRNRGEKKPGLCRIRGQGAFHHCIQSRRSLDDPLFELTFARLDLRKGGEPIAVDCMDKLAGGHQQIQVDDGGDILDPIDRTDAAKKHDQRDM